MSWQAPSAQAGGWRSPSSFDFIVAHAIDRPQAVHAAAVPYLRLAGVVLCGWQMARPMLAASAMRQEEPAFSEAKIATARYYAEALMPQARAWLAAMVQGSDTVGQLPRIGFRRSKPAARRGVGRSRVPKGPSWSA